MQKALCSVFAALALIAAGCVGAKAEDTLEPHVVKTEKILPDETPPADQKADEKADAAAASGKFAQRLFAGEAIKTQKSYACFIRQYDGAHLAQHPLQKVSAMKLLVTAEIVPEDENLNYGFRLGVKFRDKPQDKRHEFSSAGDCGHAQASEETGGKERLGCGVDCDGGGLSIELSEDNKSMLVKPESIRIWRGTRSEDQDGRLETGKDDKVFRLERAPVEQCLSLANDRKERAIMRKLVARN